jgi:cytochrome c oxidase cbb3-type subunit 3/ubiquinol-cytochrome c reductase cytochrome c subunit
VIRAFLYALSFAAVFVLLGCQARSSSSRRWDGGAATPASDSTDAATLYASFCAVCHGADGTGYKADNAPSLVSRTFVESATEDQLRRSIADGRPGTSMAAYGTEHGGPLGPVPVARLIAWIRSHAPDAKIPRRGIGDAARGALAWSMNCEKCHGSTTRSGTAVQLFNPGFLAVASDPFIGWAIAKGRPGTPMEAWEGKLSAGQIDDLVAFIRSAGKPVQATSLPPPTGKEPIVLNPRGKAPEFKPRSTPCTPTPTKECTPDERFVSIDQVRDALADGRRIVIIDARPQSEWMRVHIPGAVSIPYHDLKRLEEVPNDGTWIIAYCACPHHLSGNVVDALRAKGVRRAAILDEGILEWHRRGYPVIAAEGVQPPLKR